MPVIQSVVEVFGLADGELLAVLVLGVTGLVALGWGAMNIRDGYEIWSHDPIDAAAVGHESGIVEVSGTAKPLDGTITAPYSNERCLAYEYQRKEREHDFDDDDDTHDWRTVDRGSEHVPFLVEDESGRVPVDPEGAEISMSDSDYSSRHRTKQIEGRLDVGEAVHVFGHKQRNGGGALADEPFHIGDGDEANFRIADTTENRLVFRLFAKGGGAMIFGLIFLGITGLLVRSGMA